MKRKRTYQTVDVESFDVLAVLQLLTVGCVIAIDVAKTKFVAAIATAAGLKLLRFEHPALRRIRVGDDGCEEGEESGLRARCVRRDARLRRREGPKFRRVWTKEA